MTGKDWVSLLIYVLLFAAPGLAFITLSRRANDPSGPDALDEELFGEEPPPDRLDLFAVGSDIGYWEAYDSFSRFELNEKARALLGMRKTSPAGAADFESAIAPIDRERMLTTIREAVTSGWIHARFKVNDESLDRWVELRGGLVQEPDAENDTGGMRYVGVVMDATEHVRHEARMRANERRLRMAIESFTEPLALWDRRNRLIFWNGAYATTFGLEDVLRPGISADTVSVARSGAVRNEAVSTDENNTTVYTLHNGRHIKMIERTTENGGTISFGLDITKLLESQQQLSQQQKKLKVLVSELERSEGRAGEMARKYSEEKARAEYASRTKSAFLANMSHELRTPLNAVNGFSEIIATELFGPVGDPRYKEYAVDILTSGQHLLDMINEILDMAKIEAGKMSIDPRRIDPVDPVDAAVRMMRRRAEDKSISLILEHDEDLPDISADHRAVRQMVLNLISNAIKFTGQGGQITVKIRRVEDEIEFGVRDTGVGISKEDLPRLGQPFEQVKDVKDINSEGTGLGLALTKSFAEMHGGRLTLDSKIGEGTLIRFYLPIDGPTAIVSKELSLTSEKNEAAEEVVGAPEDLFDSSPA